MKVITFLTKYSPWLLVASIVTGILSGVLSSVMIALVNERMASIEEPIKMLAMVYVVVTASALFAELLSRLSLLRLSTKAVRQMRLRLCDQILNSSLRNVERHGSGKLMAALTEDIAAITEALTQFPVQCIHVAIITGCFAYLYYLSWELATAFLLLFSLGIVVYELIARRTRPLLEKGRLKWDELISHYNGLIDGNKELKLHRPRRHGFAEQELRPTAKQMMQLSWGWNKIFSIAEAYGQFIYYILIGFVLFIAPAFGAFESSILTGFVLMALFMSSPFSSLVGSFPVFHRADISLERIKSLGLSFQNDEDKDIDETDHSERSKFGKFESLEMRKFTFQYMGEGDEQGFSVGPVDFKLNRGELVFVIGGNGSGKSSFGRLLSGLYPQDDGELVVNEQVVHHLDKDDYRQHFSVIFSDYYLFQTLYGMISDELSERVDEYLAKLQLQDKVDFHTDKLSTVDLSQGQRKRLALLTAFVEDRDIFLFDEWAADQDPEFKAVFYYEILPELKAKGKTIVVISHDDHYFDVADRIVRFADGKIVEDAAISDANINFERPVLSV